MSVQKSIDKAWNAYEILLFSLCHPPSFMLFWCVFDSYGFGAFLVLNWCGFQSRIDKASKQPQKCTNIGWKTAWITEDDIMNTVGFHKCFMLYLCCFRSIRIWCAFGALSMLVCLFVGIGYKQVCARVVQNIINAIVVFGVYTSSNFLVNRGFRTEFSSPN